MSPEFSPNSRSKWQKKLFDIIFEADTLSGKIFDIALLVAIFLSVMLVILESVKELKTAHVLMFRYAEWGFTIFFSIEYLLRIIIVQERKKYTTSFFGIIDLLSILPSLVGFFFVGAQSFMIIRGFRLLRIFRIFKLTKYLGEASQLSTALRASRNKITIFIGTIVIIVSILGAIMYIIEPDESGFTNIPKGIYWAIVTLTTVGYGDIAPITPFGQIIASFVMILGYGVIAVPTGIVSSEMSKQRDLPSELDCERCGTANHNKQARYCYKCGHKQPFDEIS
ncbi:MAG: voltage-gated potassium channel [Marivirga sp.]|jgi:voltage-gated potassium channel